jgi:N-acetylmuramoyl-L-alanine amidase
MAKIKGTIDPGHGGGDRNNRGPNGYIEADGVLDISKRLKVKLESTGAFDIQLTRDRDMSLGLSERARKAVANKSEFFISEHTNASSAIASGTEVYYSVDSPGARGLAAELSASVANTLGIPNRGAKVRQSSRNLGEDYYTVIDVAQDGGIANAFIIESAFHSNPKEEKLLLDPSKRDAIAEAQAKAICKHYNIDYNSGSSGQVGGVDTDTLNLQKTLNRLKIVDSEGMVLAEDGSYGPATKSAVRNFQSIVGIEVDGSAGPQTKGVINQILSKPVMKKGTKNIVVRYIQYRVGASIDGSFGPDTDRKVRAWQQSNGLEADGSVGPKTWNKLIG